MHNATVEAFNEAFATAPAAPRRAVVCEAYTKPEALRRVLLTCKGVPIGGATLAAPAYMPSDAEIIQAALLAPAPRPLNPRIARALAFVHAYRTDPKVPRLLRMHLYDCLVRPVINFF